MEPSQNSFGLQMLGDDFRSVSLIDSPQNEPIDGFFRGSSNLDFYLMSKAIGKGIPVSMYDTEMSSRPNYAKLFKSKPRKTLCEGQSWNSKRKRIRPSSQEITERTIRRCRKMLDAFIDQIKTPVYSVGAKIEKEEFLFTDTGDKSKIHFTVNRLKDRVPGPNLRVIKIDSYGNFD